MDAPGVGGLDLNTATAEELDRVLPRIGPAKAKAIVEYRKARREGADGETGGVNAIFFCDSGRGGRASNSMSFCHRPCPSM